MRARLTRGWTGARLRGRDESGAVAVIVALSLVAIFAMMILTVDVGGLLLKRRAMVNASDAAALAAAQSCADTEDTLDPDAQAFKYAHENVDALVPGDGGITELVGCDTGRGHVSVFYSIPQTLFFAGVLGLGQDRPVATEATAAWGPVAGGSVVPIVIESGYLQGVCKVPDGVSVGDTCSLYYNNGDSSLGDGNWGFMNLDQWNVSSTEGCHSAGSADRRDWILNDFPDLLSLNGNPPGSAPTYVCNDTGHSSSNWQDLVDRMTLNSILMFPVNDCDGQLDKSGSVSPCPSTPDKYDIIGFTKLKLTAVYKGNDPAAIGSPGASGTCQPAISAFTTGQVWNFSSSYGTAGCPSQKPDTVSTVSITPKKGAAYNQCAPGDLSASCAYWYDPSVPSITWRTAPANNLKVQYDWSMNGTPGACGTHPSDPNAICLVTEWRGFTTGPGPIGSGDDFGTHAFALCDLAIGSCPEET
jgi:Putative Flp pilus-assembly TadE/G-like